MILRPEHVFDGHNDAITRYTSDDDDWTFLERSDKGHLDLPRAREGGFVGGFFAIFPGIEPDTWFPRGAHFHTRPGGGFHVDPPPPLPEDVAFECSERMFDRFDATVRDAAGDVVVARTRQELDDGLDRGALTIIAHFEGAEALGADLRHFDHFFDRGLRSVGPVWSRANAFGHGVPFAYPASPDIGPGLADAGFELVRECDRRGVIVDLAHMNEAGFWDVASVTTRPLVVTHTAAHALSPKARNVTDAQIDAVAESGGVIGITFFTADLTASDDPDPEVASSRIVDHIRYVADRVGPAHIALGSDFDGAPIPQDMKDASGLGVVPRLLRANGFDDATLAQVTHGNWLRILHGALCP